MANNSVRATVVLRNDTAANWNTKNPILARGEIGIEIDTNRLKVRDEITNYRNLSYIIGSGSTVIDNNLITYVNSELTIADFGHSYWYYNEQTSTEVQVIETDLNNWPEKVELEVSNGTARWVVPKISYNALQGKIDGALITLARDPIYSNEAATMRYVQNAIINATDGTLKRLSVQILPTGNNIQPNTIYMIKDDSVTNGDTYKEYLLIGSTLEQIGDTSVNLEEYVQKIYPMQEGNLVSLGADGSLIDTGISALDVGSLSVATTTTLGGVYASAEPNYINVDNTGHMLLNQVATNLLYVPAGSEFILNGGSA